MKLIIIILNLLIFVIPTFLLVTRKTPEDGFSKFWLLAALFYIALIVFRLNTGKIIFGDPAKGYTTIVFFVMLFTFVSIFFSIGFELTEYYKPFLYSLFLTTVVMFLFFYKYPWHAGETYSKKSIYIIYGIMLYIINYANIVYINAAGYYGTPSRFQVEVLSEYKNKGGHTGVGGAVSGTSHFIKVKNWYNPKKKKNLNATSGMSSSYYNGLDIVEKTGLLGIKSFRAEPLRYKTNDEYEKEPQAGSIQVVISDEWKTYNDEFIRFRLPKNFILYLGGNREQGEYSMNSSTSHAFSRFGFVVQLEKVTPKDLEYDWDHYFKNQFEKEGHQVVKTGYFNTNAGEKIHYAVIGFTPLFSIEYYVKFNMILSDSNAKYKLSSWSSQIKKESFDETFEALKAIVQSVEIKK